MLIVAIVIVAVALALAAGSAIALRRRPVKLHWRPPAHVQDDSWADFERQFWAYVRDHEHEAH